MASRLTALLGFLLVAPLLAGCGQPAEGGFDVEVRSLEPTEVRSDPDGLPPAVPEQTGEGRGHLAGVVVDQAIRPIEGAVVRLPSLDLTRLTDRDGSFGFVDLVPAPYFIEVTADGFLPAEALVSVADGEFTRAKVVLTAIPPAEPYRTMQEFTGFVDVSSTPYAAGTLVCQHCDFPFTLSPEGLDTLVVEAAFDAPTAGNQQSFMAWLQGQRTGGTWLCIVCDVQADPVRIEVRGDDLANQTDWNLRAEPQTSPLPETNVRFHVFVTAFYHQAAPAGWSFVKGDP